MHKIDSVLIVDSDEMDNFVNRKILEHHGVSNIIIFNKHFNAFDFENIQFGYFNMQLLVLIKASELVSILLIHSLN